MPDPGDTVEDHVDVDVRAWVEAVRGNPARHRDRQVTEIVLAAIGLAPTLATALVLKGGTLMALAFGSRRSTSDVDFTAGADPTNFESTLRRELDAQLPIAAVRLGYTDLVCRVQSVRKKPRPENFEGQLFPALQVTIGSAKRGTGEARRLETGTAPRIVEIEISFRDQVYHAQDLRLSGIGVSLRAFTLHEIIAEKLRALLQQPSRNRSRQQDVYDIAYLLDDHTIDADDRRLIYRTLIDKCGTRGIVPDRRSLDDPEVVRRARAGWATLQLELGVLPPFDERYAIVRAFYESLPWLMAE